MKIEDLIDVTCFYKEPLYVANARNIDSRGSNQPNQSDFLTALISKHVRDVLIDALGAKVFNQLVEALKNDNLELAKNAKFKKLINGETYEKSNKTYIFDGLKGYNKDSLLAYFVYCQYLIEDTSKVSTTGAVILKNEAAESVNTTDKYVNAWQEFKRMYQGGIEPDNAPRVIINGFGSVGLDYYGTEGQTNVSLLQYLLDINEIREEAEKFSEFQFKYITLEESYNSFGF